MNTALLLPGRSRCQNDEQQHASQEKEEQQNASQEKRKLSLDRAQSVKKTIVVVAVKMWNLK